LIFVFLAGRALNKGIELLKYYQKELASIPWKYKAYASVGFCYSCRDRSPFGQLVAPPASDSSLSLSVTISHLTAFVRASEEPVLSASRLKARSIHIYLFLNRGDAEVIKIEVSSLKLLCGSSSKLFLSVEAEADSDGEFDLGRCLIPLLSMANSELHVALPCTKIWLHLFAWSKVISAVVAFAAPSATVYGNATPVSPSSDQHLPNFSGQSTTAHSPLELGADSLPEAVEMLGDGPIVDSGDSGALIRNVDIPSGRSPGPPETGHDKRWPVQLKFGTMNVVVILPDYVIESQPDHRNYLKRTRKTPPEVLWKGVGNIREDISVSK
jgi:hypothetical protein